MYNLYSAEGGSSDFMSSWAAAVSNKSHSREPSSSLLTPASVTAPVAVIQEPIATVIPTLDEGTAATVTNELTTTKVDDGVFTSLWLADDKHEEEESSTDGSNLEPKLIHTPIPIQMKSVSAELTGDVVPPTEPIIPNVESSDVAGETDSSTSASTTGDNTEMESSAGTIVEDNSDCKMSPEVTRLDLVAAVAVASPDPVAADEMETRECTSKVSSRATSSISVISEEKDSLEGSPQPEGSPTGRAMSIDSHTVPKRYMDSADYCTLLGTVETTIETPSTHSRSNSNTTSSSFERIDELRYNKTSSSSSDIEVIPIDSYFHARQQTSQMSTMTQTEEPWPVVKPSDKDEEILQLREEGEKLSKKQFEYLTAIKKLRLKEKESDLLIKNLKSELVVKSTEIDKLHKTFILKETLEQNQNETIGKLINEKRNSEEVINKLKSELEDCNDNCASMKASLENSAM